MRLPALGEDGLLSGLLDRLASVYRHRSLDRLLAGRVWIGLVAFALIGIVTLQLGLLKLNAGVGHSLERASVLQRQNSALAIENSEMAAGNRVEAAAGGLGMQLVPSGALEFLSAHAHADARHAAAALATPVHAPSTETSETSTTEGSGEAEAGEEGSASGASGESSETGESASSEGETAAGSQTQSESPTSSEAATESSAAGPSEGESSPTGGAQAGPAE